MIEEVRASGIPIYPLQPGDLLRRMPPDCHHAWEYPDGRMIIYQPHAHIMVTMRSIDVDGFGLKQREWNSPVLLNRWRESWERTYNNVLAAVGNPHRVSAKAKRKVHQEALAAAGVDAESPEAPAEPLRQLDLKGGIYAARDGRPPKQIYGAIPMPAFDWNERLRQLRHEQAAAEKTKNESAERAKHWQNAWETAQADALAQQQRAQEAERETRSSEEKFEAEQKARLDLERGVETLTDQLASPLGDGAPKKGSVLERLQTAAAGVTALLRKETARADKAEKIAKGLARYLRDLFEWARERIPGERPYLDAEDSRIFGRRHVPKEPARTEGSAAEPAEGANAEKTGLADALPASPPRVKNHLATAKFRKRSAAVSPLLWTPPDRQVARPGGSKRSKTKEPLEVQPPSVRKRDRDEHQR